MAQEPDGAQDGFEQLRDSLVARVEAALRRQNGKLRKLSGALEECANEEMYRRQGELLKANLSRLKRGQAKVKVVDYYGDGQPEIEIEVAADKTPLENMEAFFKRARKLKRGRPRIEREMELTQERISQLEELRASAAGAAPEELEELTARVEAALAPRKRRKPKGKPGPKLGPRRFVSSEGYDILVGRNQRQNDRLTLTIARGSDVFVHAGSSPGSHVIIRTGTKSSVPRRTMLEAANLAVYYSKLRNSRYAEVSWTQVKNVSKPRGAKPGLVYLSKHKVLGIEPDGELVKILHENAREL